MYRSDIFFESQYFSFCEVCLASTNLLANNFYWQTGAEANAHGPKTTPNSMFRTWRNISDNIASITLTTQQLTLFTRCRVFATASATLVTRPSVTTITPEFSALYFIREPVACSFSARHLRLSTTFLPFHLARGRHRLGKLAQ